MLLMKALNSRSLFRHMEEPGLVFSLACSNAEEYTTSLNMIDSKRAKLALIREISITAANDYLAQLAIL